MSSSDASADNSPAPAPAAAARLRVLVFGATGRLGAEIVRLMLARPARFAVAAFVRARRSGAARLPFDAAAVRVIEGSTDDAVAVAAAVAEADVVVHALGHVYGETDASFMTRLMASVLAAMRRSPACTRLVDVSGVTSFEGGDARLLLYSLMDTYLRIAKPTVLADHAGKTAAIKAAAAEWPALRYTIARPPILTEGAARGYRACAVADAACTSFVSRADVAAFMVDEVDAPKWPNAAPIVCGR